MKVELVFNVDKFDREKMIEVLVSEYDAKEGFYSGKTDAELISLYLSVLIPSNEDGDGVVGLILKTINV